jgi:hypothetical protein
LKGVNADHGGQAREISNLEMQAARAAQAGRMDEAASYWGRILQVDPGHAASLRALGNMAYRKGDLEAARVAFGRLVKAAGSDPQHWVSLAACCRDLGDQDGEEEAVQGAMKADPGDLLALLMRGNLYERQGRRHLAARAYGAAATVAPPRERLVPDLRQPLAHAEIYKSTYDEEFAAFLDRHLEGPAQGLEGSDLRRFRESVDLMTGRKRRYDSQSVRYHYPRLPAIEFFDRDQFPWMEAMERPPTRSARSSCRFSKGTKGSCPTSSTRGPAEEPVERTRPLAPLERVAPHRDGPAPDANADRCPKTMQALAGGAAAG